MRKVKVFAVSATIFAVGFGVWTASTTNARAPSLSEGIDPHHMMMNARALPAMEFADYTFVFR
jgi:hypothetical protein